MLRRRSNPYAIRSQPWPKRTTDGRSGVMPHAAQDGVNNGQPGHPDHLPTGHGAAHLLRAGSPTHETLASAALLLLRGPTIATSPATGGGERASASGPAGGAREEALGYVGGACPPSG